MGMTIPPATDEHVSMALLLLGHAHLSIGTRAHTTSAVAAFRASSVADPTSLPAEASAGRALILLARMRLSSSGDRVDSGSGSVRLSTNRTLELAVVSFRRLVTLLEAQGVAVGARRSDLWGARRPLWWADALSGLGQALQLLAASNDVRSRQAGPPRAKGYPSAGSAMLTRAARAWYEHGVHIGLWHNAWQRWNVEPPRHLVATSGALRDDRHTMGWVERSAPYYPHATVALLEANWRTIRDECLSWHRSLATAATSPAAADTTDGKRGSGEEDEEGSGFAAASVEDDETLLHTGSWRLLRFMHPSSSGWINGSAAAAPLTAALLKRVPALRECAANDTCFELTAQLSHLVKGSHIAPHCGRGRLSLMLPLIAPPGCCRLQVGPMEPRELIEGRVIVFDDSWEHQAFADSDRMVLIVDVPRADRRKRYSKRSHRG